MSLPLPFAFSSVFEDILGYRLNSAITVSPVKCWTAISRSIMRSVQLTLVPCSERHYCQMPYSAGAIFSHCSLLFRWHLIIFMSKTHSWGANYRLMKSWMSRSGISDFSRAQRLFPDSPGSLALLRPLLVSNPRVLITAKRPVAEQWRANFI